MKKLLFLLVVLVATGCASVAPPKGDFFVKVGTDEEGKTVFVPSETVETVLKATEDIQGNFGSTPWGLIVGAAGSALGLGVSVYARSLNNRLSKVEASK